MEFSSFSSKQLSVLRWWMLPQYQNYDAIICDGAVRSGKTLSLSLSFVMWGMVKFHRQSFALCGKTVTSLERNVVRPLVSVLKDSGFQVKELLSKHCIDVTAYGHVNRFYLFGGRDEGSASLIQGMTLAGVLLDEVALMPRSFVEQAMARCSVKGAKFWFSCNPEHPYHWFYQEWICKAHEKCALYLHFTMQDNPSLSKDVIQRYERLYSGVFYERFVLGKWTVSEGIIYPMFDKNKHVVSQLPENFSRYVASCDYGTMNPTSVGVWGLSDNIWYRICEYYYDARKEGSPRTDEQHYSHVHQMLKQYPVEYIVADPSAASFIACITAHHQYRVVKAKNDVLDGIRRVCDALQSDKLRFSDSCKDIIREFSQYCWNFNTGGDVPKKEFDHAMDDMRYFVSTVLYGAQDYDFTALSVGR